jgi:hypothetical protein
MPITDIGLQADRFRVKPSDLAVLVVKVWEKRSRGVPSVGTRPDNVRDHELSTCDCPIANEYSASLAWRECCRRFGEESAQVVRQPDYFEWFVHCGASESENGVHVGAIGTPSWPRSASVAPSNARSG